MNRNQIRIIHSRCTYMAYHVLKLALILIALSLIMANYHFISLSLRLCSYYNKVNSQAVPHHNSKNEIAQLNNNGEMKLNQTPNWILRNANQNSKPTPHNLMILWNTLQAFIGTVDDLCHSSQKMKDQETRTGKDTGRKNDVHRKQN